MARTGYVYDTGMLAHRDPRDHTHPESPERLVSIMELFESKGLIQQATKIPLDLDDIIGIPEVHSTGHHERMLGTHKMTDEELKGLADKYDSVYLCKDSVRSALLAVGSAVSLARAIVEDVVDNGFAIIRPPGHHAEYDEPMGFCIYNNVAVTAKTLMGSYRNKKVCVSRILILDWDIHHGNGTQNAFIDDPNVLFVSLHRYDEAGFYPHNPIADMVHVGTGAAAGRTVNIPWAGPGYGDAEYLHAFHRLVMPIAHEFNPDLVIVSAGFDAAQGDPIGECCVTPAGFAHMTYLLKGLAGGKVMLALEGGYNIQAVANSSEACMRVLLGEMPPRLPTALQPAHPACVSTVEQVVQVQSPYWNCLRPKMLQSPPSAHMVALDSLVLNQWSRWLTTSFPMLPLPILDERFTANFSGRVHITEEILDNGGDILLIAHESDPILMKSAPETNSVNTKSSFFEPAFADYIQAAFDRGVSIIDVYTPAKAWKLRQTSVTPSHELESSNEFFLYLWDTFLAQAKAKNIYLISSGISSYSVCKMLDARNVEDKVKASVVFSQTLFLPIVAPEKGAWYQKISKVFVPGSGKAINAAIPTANLYGNCYASGPDGPLQNLTTALTLKSEILDFIFGKQ